MGVDIENKNGVVTVHGKGDVYKRQEYNASYLEQIRPLLKPGALVTDVGLSLIHI